MNNKLFRLLQQANDNSLYYNNLFTKCGFDYYNFCVEQYSDIPVLSRETLLTNAQDILHKDYHYINRKDLVVERTSGSTGHYVEVFWNNNEFIRSNMCLWRRRYQWYGISPEDRECTFFTAGTTTEKIIFKKNRIEFSSIYMGEKDIENYLTNIFRFQPKWLMLSPSIALLLLDFCRNRGLSLPLSVKYIELFGENVSPAAYKSIVDYFNTPTAIMYGAKEVNGIALTCPYGHMHILSDNNYLEVVDRGKVLITNLHNTVFPIIRYDIGDMAKIKTTPCPCGETGLVIDRILGKSHHLAYLDKHSGITTSMLKGVIDDVDAIFDYPIIQFQIQYTTNSIVVHLYCKNEYRKWENEIANEFSQKTQQYALQDMTIQFKFHKSPLPYNKAIGKLPIAIIN